MSSNIVQQIQFYTFQQQNQFVLKSHIPLPLQGGVIFVSRTQGCGALRLTLG